MSREIFRTLQARCWGPDPDPWGFNRRRSVRTALPALPSGSQQRPSLPTRHLGAWRCTAHGTVTREPVCQCGTRFRFFDPRAETPVEPLPIRVLTLEDALREEGLERVPESNAPATPPQRLAERQRDARGRYVAEPLAADRARVPSQAETYARIRRDWYHLPNGAKKPYARELGLPIGTVRGIARGRRTGLKPRVLRTAVPGRSAIVEGGLPEAVIRRLARVHAEIDRGERVLVKTTQRWPNGCPRFVWRRCPPQAVGDAGVKT